ncbi:GrpB family protein [Leptolyngbyaceae cyanobacterium CCMR0082]|uniref:GrpB family protein n=1 Tax=Adonisia turfae CCMR0082 TaxID=2304604 RepID=A0A6M0SC23_9CYAN|nr:GrpB family protein [Adonisia turfae]NEZ65876.1 GrpB family protein [Adonisia turfae CCMR0082]
MIVIHSYKPTWPQEFAAIKAALTKILGAQALCIDHIGSTSVPGLGAKDVIDIQLTVQVLTPNIPEKLTEAGYYHREHITCDHVPLGADATPHLWKKQFFHQPDGQRRANIHVRVEGNPNQQYPLLFRDYLRSHPNSAKSVELIKREIAKRHGDDIDAYYDIKDPVYDLIWEAALAWSKGLSKVE